MKTIIAIALVFFAQEALCQTYDYAHIPCFQEHNKEPYDVPTPNQSSLGTYGIIPVSPYTGKADISIPLYNTSQRDVALNISLTYDTSGLLINQLPGWTGHNWTLNAGGAITRKINGRPDEISYEDTNAGRDIFYQHQQTELILELTNGQCMTMDDLSINGFWYEYSLMNSMFQNDSEAVIEYSHYANYFSAANSSYLYNDSTPRTFDASADVFYFNFMGISGSFFYGNDGKWKVRSDQNIHVEFDVTDTTNYIRPFQEIYGASMPGLIIKQPKTIKGFTLIDEQGNKYIFGGDTASIEYSMSLMGQVIVNTTEPWNAISWMLKEVKDRFDNTLYRFKYSRGTDIVQIQHAYNSDILYTSGNTVGIHYFDKKYSATINAPVYLDSIYIADGTRIFFNHSKLYTNNAAQNLYSDDSNPSNYSSKIGLILNNIKTATYPMLKPNLYQQNNPNGLYYYPFLDMYLNFVTSYDWCDDYMENMNLEKLKEIRVISPINQNGQELNNVFTLLYDNNKRMHLTSVIYSSGSNYSNAYSYDLEYDRFDYLPSDYLTKAFDFWGYYNGVDYDSDNTLMSGSPNDTYLNRLNSGSNVPGVPNLNYGTMGMLKKIIYPTGGYSLLEYEQNTCSRYMSENKQSSINLTTDIPVGGLRIKSISNYDNGVLVGKKNYTYNREGSQLSSGELYSLPKFHYAWADNKCAYVLNIYSSSVPLSNAVSPIVGYSNIRETELDGSYTTYAYSNYSMEKDDMFLNSRWGTNTITPFDEFSSRQYMCGRLLEETKLKSNGDSLQHTIYTYESDNSFNNSNYAVTTCYNIHNLFAKVGSRFKMYYFRPGITSIITKTKYGNSWVKDEITYNREHKNLAISNQQYADVWNVLSETRKRGSNQLRTEYRYPYHNTGVNNNLVQQFCLPVTSTKHYLDNNLIDGSKTFYRNAGKIVPDYDIVFASDSTKCDTVAQYISYSSTYRITEMLDRSHVSHKYYWNNRDQLIGAVTNGSINVNGANTDINTIMSNNSSVIYASIPTDALLYEYNNQGKVSKTVGGNGMSASYDYDLFGRLTNIKDTYGSTTNRYTYNYVNKTDSIFAQQLTHCYMNANLIENTRNVRIEYAFPYTTSEARIYIKRQAVLNNPTVYSNTLPTDKTDGEIIVSLNSSGRHIVYYRVDGNLIAQKQLNVY